VNRISLFPKMAHNCPSIIPVVLPPWRPLNAGFFVERHFFHHSLPKPHQSSTILFSCRPTMPAGLQRPSPRPTGELLPKKLTTGFPAFVYPFKYSPASPVIYLHNIEPFSHPLPNVVNKYPNIHPKTLCTLPLFLPFLLLVFPRTFHEYHHFLPLQLLSSHFSGISSYDVSLLDPSPLPRPR